MTETQKQRWELAHKFVYKLDLLDGPDGRRRLAELRRAAHDPLTDVRIFSVIGDDLPSDAGHKELDIYRIVAVLIALHKQKVNGKRLPAFERGKAEDGRTPAESFGVSLRRLRASLKNGQESLDQRFGALLNSHSDDLYYHLRQMVQRIAGRDEIIPINYTRLALDLLDWDHPSRIVQRTWARHYWQSPSRDQEVAA